MSWALILEPVAPDQTRLYIRLRATSPGRKAQARLMRMVGGLVDWLTIVLLFQGLNERVKMPGS